MKSNFVKKIFCLTVLLSLSTLTVFAQPVDNQKRGKNDQNNQNQMMPPPPKCLKGTILVKDGDAYIKTDNSFIALTTLDDQKNECSKDMKNVPDSKNDKNNMMPPQDFQNNQNPNCPPDFNDNKKQSKNDKDQKVPVSTKDLLDLQNKNVTVTGELAGDKFCVFEVCIK